MERRKLTDTERRRPEREFGPVRQAVADAIFEVLRAEHSLHRKVILERVQAKGVHIESAKPLSYVATILTLDDRFKKVHHYGYWMLAENARENCRNCLTSLVKCKCEIEDVDTLIQSETAKGWNPSAASTKRESDSPMATLNSTTVRQANNGKNSTPSPLAFNLITALGPESPDDGDIGRQQRGIAIAAVAHIKKTKVGYSVKSQSGKGISYAVRLDGATGPACECDDFDLRNRPCKHIYAAQCYEMRDGEHGAAIAPIDIAIPKEPVAESVAEQTAKNGRGREKAEPMVMEMPTLKPIEPKPATNSKDGRNWPAYNKGQDIEGDVFPVLLRELCDTIEEPEQKGPGRRSLPLADMVFAATAKTYGLMSARRSAKSMREAVSKCQMEQVPSFASIMRYLDKPELTPILVSLIEQSAVPLAGLESHFSPDSSGFGTDVHDEWFVEKHGKPTQRGKRAKYIKAHIMSGAKTKIVTAVKVTVENSADCPQLPELVETTAKNFTLEEVSADKAYLAHYSFRAIRGVGAVPFIPFKRDSVASNSHHKKDPLWTMLYHFFHLHREEFLQHYHQRSNVETAFSMIKRKFNGFVRTKNPTAQVNEVLTKILCHNIYVLIMAMTERDIMPNWKPVVEQFGEQLGLVE